MAPISRRSLSASASVSESEASWATCADRGAIDRHGLAHAIGGARYLGGGARARAPMIFGAHESVAGGLSRCSVARAVDGCHAIQVFTKNSNQWKEPALTAEGIAAFKEGRAAYGPVPVMAHASYLINLGTDDGTILGRSIDSLVAEVERSSALGIDYVVLHPGAHLGAGEEVGLERVCEALDAVHERTEGASARVLLENTAGQGTCIGHRFEHLQAIFDGSKTSDRLGVCFDTQHAFAAGYDLSTEEGYEKTWASLDACVGLARLRAFHLNDSKKPLGARVDRHEHLGEGVIGLGAFWRLANDKRFAETPGVLETEPREGGEPFKAEVAMLAGLVGAKPPPAKPAFALEVVPKPRRAGRARRHGRRSSPFQPGDERLDGRTGSARGGAGRGPGRKRLVGRRPRTREALPSRREALASEGGAGLGGQATLVVSSAYRSRRRAAGRRGELVRHRPALRTPRAVARWAAVMDAPRNRRRRAMTQPKSGNSSHGDGGRIGTDASTLLRLTQTAPSRTKCSFRAPFPGLISRENQGFGPLHQAVHTPLSANRWSGAPRFPRDAGQEGERRPNRKDSRT